MRPLLVLISAYGTLILEDSKKKTEFRKNSSSVQLSPNTQVLNKSIH